MRQENHFPWEGKQLKNELKERAKKLYFRENGKITPKEIAQKLGTTPEKVRKWKYEGKWAEELEKPRKGAPRGNRNAAGHGAPEGNTNAETHGAYSTPRLELLDEATRKEIEELQGTFDGNALRELKRLEAKRADLERRIGALQNLPEDQAELLDRTMTMTLPDGGAMEYISKSSPFSRRMTLEAELNRVDGRIIKLLDSIKSQEAEGKRLELERERLEFNKQKARGVFNFGEDGTALPDEETDEIVEE